jgi:hypothetical protein
MAGGPRKGGAGSRRLAHLGALLACGLLVAACGGGGSKASGTGTASAALPKTTTTASATPAPAVNELAAAQNPKLSDFPSAAGKSLKQLALQIKQTAQLGAGTAVYTVGRSRFAFALTDKQNRFIYAPTAIYISRGINGPARGPFLTPADPTTVAPQFRSAQNSGPGGLSAVYWTTLSVPKSGIWDVLALTRVGSHLIGSTGEMPVALNTPIPSVGQHPPAIATDTLASTNGNIKLVTTRTPPENMHAVPFNQVLGKKPIALLFSTPELCHSRVCGPVTDIMVELQHEFGSRVQFIHQEVYVNNNPTKGLRHQLVAFHLQTEPWLFTVNRQGVIVSRLEGVYGVNEARAAVQAALR